MDIVVAGIAVAAFAATVFVLASVGSRSRPDRVRTVSLPESEGWMTVDELAVVLDVSPSEVISLVEREAVPFYLVAGGALSNRADYRFKRDEIDAWTIG